MAAQESPLLGYRPKLLKRVEVAEGTMSFYFEKPSGFDYKPGQSSDLTLLDPPETDAEGNVRTFSIASAPLWHRASTRMTSELRNLLDTEARASSSSDLRGDV